MGTQERQLTARSGQSTANKPARFFCKFGKYWEAQANQISHKAGYRHHYMMVFESNPVDGAHTTDDVLKLIEAL